MTAQVIDFAAAAKAVAAIEPAVGVLFFPTGVEIAGLITITPSGFDVKNPMVVVSQQLGDGKQTINLMPFQLGYSLAFADGVFVPANNVGSFARATKEFADSYNKSVARFKSAMSGIILPNAGLLRPDDNAA